MNNNTFTTARETLDSYPDNRISGELCALLSREITHEERLAELCLEAYRNADRPAFLLYTLEELATRNERRCGELRSILAQLRSAGRMECGESLSPITRGGADIGCAIDISYHAETKTLQVLLPELLPLKTAKAEFLPGKVRRAMRQFDTEHRHNGGEPIRIFPAFVVLVHHYDAARRGKNHLRDYDNLEWSAMLNALQCTHYFSDNAAEMTLMQMAVPDESSFTEIIIAPMTQMPELLQRLDFSLYNRPEQGDTAASA